MEHHEHRLGRIRRHLEDAHAELHALPASEREGCEAGLARLEDVVAHASAVLAATDPGLVSSTIAGAIETAACEISNHPRAALGEAEACADAILDAVAMLPLKRASDSEDALARAEERLNAVQEDVAAAGARLEAIAARFASVDETIAAQQSALAANHERQAKAHDEVEEHLNEIRRMHDESASLVETLGLAGTSEVYRRQGRRQRIAAEVLRALAVLAGLGSVAVALVTAHSEATGESLVADLFACVLLAGLAAYLARQSARHRAREERVSSLRFELAAFGPFIESLSPERREEERVIMARKIFGTSPPAAVPDGDDPLFRLLAEREPSGRAAGRSGATRHNGSSTSAAGSPRAERVPASSNGRRGNGHAAS